MQMTDVMTAALSKSMATASTNVLLTAVTLSTAHGAMLSQDTLAEIMGVKTETIRKQISLETFPVPVTRIGQRWFATAFDLAEYLEREKQTFGG